MDKPLRAGDVENHFCRRITLLHIDSHGLARAARTVLDVDVGIMAVGEGLVVLRCEDVAGFRDLRLGSGNVSKVTYKS